MLNCVSRAGKKHQSFPMVIFARYPSRVGEALLTIDRSKIRRAWLNKGSHSGWNARFRLRNGVRDVPDLSREMRRIRDVNCRRE
jgi:hypothetical protein